jgi:hypothetical protein
MRAYDDKATSRNVCELEVTKQESQNKRNLFLLVAEVGLREILKE